MFLMAADAWSQNLEAGLQASASLIRSHVPPETELDPGLGVWLLVWPGERVAFSADWLFVWREDFLLNRNGVVLGERERNRQYVDLTLQYHFYRNNTVSIYAEIGGGALWDNREVINPGGVPDFQEQGPETTMHAMWTAGIGARKRLLRHVNWVAGFKIHNLARSGDGGSRFITGLLLSWR